MKNHIRFVAVALACGIAASMLLPPPAAAEMPRGMSRGTIVNPFPPYNPFLNYPLTPYMSVGQYFGIRNTLLYASIYGRLPPGYNPFINYPLTPYLGVGQAASLLALGGSTYGPFQPTILPPTAWPVGYTIPYPYPVPYSIPAVGAQYGIMSTYDRASALVSDAVTQSQRRAEKPQGALAQLRGHGGGLDWPLGLRVLQPKDQSKELLKRIDDQIRSMFPENEGFQATPQQIQEVSKDVEKLSGMYKSHVWDMALTRQQESDAKQFLNRVRDALVATADSAKRAETQLKTTGSGGQSTSPKSGTQPPAPAKPYNK